MQTTNKKSTMDDYPVAVSIKFGFYILEKRFSVADT